MKVVLVEMLCQLPEIDLKSVGISCQLQNNPQSPWKFYGHTKIRGVTLLLYLSPVTIGSVRWINLKFSFAVKAQSELGEMTCYLAAHWMCWHWYLRTLRVLSMCCVSYQCLSTAMCQHVMHNTCDVSGRVVQINWSMTCEPLRNNT